jgi:RecA/RadA recombinase
MRTVSAANPGDDGDNNNRTPRYLSTGLANLDKLLGDPASEVGGVCKGQVTEIWGPSGAGKTALG